VTEGNLPVISRRQAGSALALLTAVNLLSYLERNAIFALFEPLKKGLGLSDSQLGWLGTAYVLVFSLASLPLGLLGDLRSRRAVIAGGVLVWSLATSLSGLALGFQSLFIARALVGLGGAAAAAAAASLVADYYPGQRRAFAMGIFMTGLAVGGVLGILIAGQLEALYGWRVAFLTLGLPGIVLAALVIRLPDPTRLLPQNRMMAELAEIGIGVGSLAAACAPTLVGLALGGIAAFLLDQRLGADSRADAAAFSFLAVLGLAANILMWVKRSRSGAATVDPVIDAALADLQRAFRAVLGTPTLVYVFVGGALISFGMNGIVAWAPAYITRTLGLSSPEASRLLGLAGLVAGTAGTLAGGWLADSLRKRHPGARVLVTAAGFIIGVPLAVWLLSVRSPAFFVPLFYAAFFFLTWYNGPLTATIFDVVPTRIGTTVVGAYLLFIHVAGDSISFPLIGALSDRFGLARAIYVLPLAALAGGLVVLGARKTLARDARRAQETTTLSGR
jgi:MFS family permease